MRRGGRALPRANGVFRGDKTLFLG